ncbi:RepB family plasmid replication initiator protein [Gilliamella apicola]|uniref:RepB family plasmid replication initiator protein n=1 Tax=Gilliamella apicola TaxID=1196095 RepID=UPI001179F660
MILNRTILFRPRIRVITINELKECLDLKNEYSRFNSFRQSVIDKAVNLLKLLSLFLTLNIKM